jgi:HNH endonuclease
MSGRLWSEADVAIVRALYPNRLTAEIAAQLKCSIWRVYAKAADLGLKKTPEFLASEESGIFIKGTKLGERWRFPKGHVPTNKGLRRPGYHRGRMRQTQFKKGCRSGVAARNWVPVGTILTDSEGYLRIKVREAEHGKEPSGYGNMKVWPLLNRHIWEQAKGPIPPKHLVVFKDGDRKNCAIENLELISMADNARRNTMWRRLPRELAEAIQLNGALKRKLRRSNGQE